jgi:hypothetical protein
MMLAVYSGDVERVQRQAESLGARNVRPVLESAVCIGFNKGVGRDVLAWMANRVGTLRVRSTPYGALSLTRVITTRARVAVT